MRTCSKILAVSLALCLGVAMSGHAQPVSIQPSPGISPKTPIRSGTTAQTPTSCIPNKELWIKTDATPGQQLFICNTAGNGFVLVGDGSGGGGGGGTVTSVGTGSGLTGGPITNAGTLTCLTASGIQFGCLTAADWTTFNAKQPPGNYLVDPGGNGLVVRTALNTTSAYGGATCTNTFLRSLSISGAPTCNPVTSTDTTGTFSATMGNPSALLGLVAINGAASTAMRSDGAPALNQGIAPTWTALHTFGVGGTDGSNLSNASVITGIELNTLEGTLSVPTAAITPGVFLSRISRPASYVVGNGTLTATNAGINTAIQVQAANAFVGKDATSTGDIVASLNLSNHHGTSGIAYGLYAEANALHAGSATLGGIAFQSQTTNATGIIAPYSPVFGSSPSFVGHDAYYVGGVRSGVAFQVRSGGAPGLWEVGLGIMQAGAFKADIQSDSSAISILLANSGAHTNGIDLTGATYSGNAIMAPGFTATGAGSVGMGTTSPQKKLHVISASATTGVAIGKDDGSNLMLLGYDNAANVGVLGSYAAGVASKLAINPSGGNVGIGTVSPSQALSVVGTLTVTAIAAKAGAQTGTLCYNTGAPGTITYDAANACTASLEEYKDNLGSITNAMRLITALQPFWGKFKEDAPPGDKHIQPMFGAQQVEQVSHYLATYDLDGALSGVRYQNLTAVLVAGMQELNARLEKLEAK